MTATKSGLQACETYTLKLMVADVSDDIFDAGVLLQENSLKQASISASSATFSNNNTALEGCIEADFTFELESALDHDVEIPLTKNFREFVSASAEQKYYYNNKPLFERIKGDIKSENSVYQWRRKYVRVNKKGVVPTLTANMGRGGHNVPIIKNSEGIRKLTPKECFMLQGFPTTFKLPKGLSDSELYHQAGNSVTIPVVQRIAENIKKVLL